MGAEIEDLGYRNGVDMKAIQKNNSSRAATLSGLYFLDKAVDKQNISAATREFIFTGEINLESLDTL